MARIEVIWAEGDEGNIAHIAEHGITPDEVEQVLEHPISTAQSRSSGLPIAIGYTRARRRLAVVYVQVDLVTVFPITAYEIED